MKTLFLVRHAKSSWVNPSQADIDRPLNSRGFRDAPHMAKMIASLNQKPDALVSSPANRAFTTASFFAEAFGIYPSDIVIEPRIYEAHTSTLVNIIGLLKDQWNTVLLFGHNPGFTYLASSFEGQHISHMPTCSVVKIESTADSWNEVDAHNSRIVGFWYPKMYFEDIDHD